MLAALACAVPAQAADPGRWTLVKRTTVPLYYYQGITADPARNLYFDGIYFGLYKTDSQLHETARNDDVIPPDQMLTRNWDHMGDLTWAPGEVAGGRLLLPLECYYPIPSTNGNHCPASDLTSGAVVPGQGAIGVAGANDLKWRYYVLLDRSQESKTMWAELSPDRTLVWTQGTTPTGGAGKDLLAYRLADVNAGNDGKTIQPVRVLRGVVPPSGITGAAFYGGRMYVAGQDAGPFQVYSLDVESCDLATACDRRLEIERKITGESEGLAAVNVLGGVLQWQIQPYNTSGPPTYGIANGTVLTFVPRSTAGAVATPGGATAPVATTGPRCTTPRAHVWAGGVGRLRLGVTRATALRKLGPATFARGQVLRWCVRGGGAVTAVLSGGRVRVIATTAPGHVTGRHVAPLQRLARLRAAYAPLQRIAAGVDGSRRAPGLLFGIARGRVRYLAAVDRRLERRRAALLRALRQAR